MTGRATLLAAAPPAVADNGKGENAEDDAFSPNQLPFVVSMPRYTTAQQQQEQQQEQEKGGERDSDYLTCLSSSIRRFSCAARS